MIDKDVVYEAIEASKSQTEVLEGNYGGGTAMRCHGYKGGTGTSSRIVPGVHKDSTLGVLVQANQGQKDDLRIAMFTSDSSLSEKSEPRPHTGTWPSFHRVGKQPKEVSCHAIRSVTYQCSRLRRSHSADHVSWRFNIQN